MGRTYDPRSLDQIIGDTKTALIRLRDEYNRQGSEAQSKIGVVESIRIQVKCLSDLGYNPDGPEIQSLVKTVQLIESECDS